MQIFKREQIQDTLEGKGYKYFTGGQYDVNIIGIRNSSTNNEITNKFDDTITVSYKNENDEWQYHEYKCTTDPGKHWAENIMNESGVAILKPGQYRGSHKLGLHQGKYEALRQKSPLKVYRDKNKDGNYDMIEENIQEGIFGINIHKAGGRVNGSTQIDKWSAGCQVIASNDNWMAFLGICQTAREVHGNSFSYTLIESKDL